MLKWLKIISGFLLHKIRALKYGNQGTLLQEGSRAPDFSLCDESGKMHHLKDYLGKKVVLWFYLRARTPG
jgi:peroxiredoxin